MEEVWWRVPSAYLPQILLFTLRIIIGPPFGLDLSAVPLVLYSYRRNCPKFEPDNKTPVESDL